MLNQIYTVSKREYEDTDDNLRTDCEYQFRLLNSNNKIRVGSIIWFTDIIDKNAIFYTEVIRRIAGEYYYSSGARYCISQPLGKTS